MFKTLKKLFDNEYNVAPCIINNLSPGIISGSKLRRINLCVNFMKDGKTIGRVAMI